MSRVHLKRSAGSSLRALSAATTPRVRNGIASSLTTAMAINSINRRGPGRVPLWRHRGGVTDLHRGL